MTNMASPDMKSPSLASRLVLETVNRAHDDDAHFSVQLTRDFLYERLPTKLKGQVAYRHFFTEALDPKAGALSVKYFSLVILYFCALFKLQGRRAQYLYNESSKSGKDFAKAHKRAKAVFHKLTATYGIILMRYTTNNVLVYDRKLSLRMREDLAKTSAQNLKNPLPMVNRIPAFYYRQDEMEFFEVLLQLTQQMVRLAFAGDELFQKMAESEVVRLLRSESFLFRDKRREDDLRQTQQVMARQSNQEVLNNSKELALLLTPPVPRLVIKYCNIQRSPFMSTHFPGGTNHIRYQRPRKGFGKPPAPTKNEKSYTVETLSPAFPLEHRAMELVADALRNPTSPVRRRPQSSQSPKAQKMQHSLPPALDATANSGTTGSQQNSTNNSRSVSPDQRRAATPADESGNGANPTAADGATQPKKVRIQNMKGLRKALPDYDDSYGYEGDPSNDALQASKKDHEAVTTSIQVMHTDKTIVSEEKYPVPKLRGAAQKVVNIRRATTKPENLVPDFLASSGTEHDFDRVATTTNADRTAGVEQDRFMRLLEMPDAMWGQYDVHTEVDNIYQSLANGVEVSDLAIPSDILLDYGDDGTLLPDSMPQ